MITLVAAMEREASPLRSVFGSALWRGQVSVVLGGIGRAYPEIEFSPSPEMVLSLGFGGAARPEALVGHLVLSQNLYAVGEDRAIVADTHLTRAAEEACQKAGMAYHVANSVTVPKLVNDPREKAKLSTSFGAWSINMEDYWLAKAADKARVPFLAVRAIVDRADQMVHPSIASLALKGNGVFTQASWALAAVTLRPWLFPNIVSMARQASLAQKNLCIFAEHFIPGLLPLNTRGTEHPLVGKG